MIGRIYFWDEGIEIFFERKLERVCIVGYGVYVFFFNFWIDDVLD